MLHSKYHHKGVYNTKHFDVAADIEIIQELLGLSIAELATQAGVAERSIYSRKNNTGSISAKELRELYYPYHSLDPANAIQRILESKNLVEEDLTQKGVQILRRIMAEKQER